MKLFFINKIHRKVKAFTLLEVLASFTIVTLVILGPLTFSINSASYSRQSRDVLVAGYLAQEALELLHHQYDTLYIACANGVDACDAATVPTLTGEGSGDKAWRLFKTRLDSFPTCFTNTGCSFDFLDMTDPTVATPPKYSTIGSQCPGLSVVSANVLGFDTTIRKYFVCSSIDQADIGGRLKDNHYTVSKSTYSRTISVESIPTYELNAPTPANLDLYQDDLIITASVSFRKANGAIRKIEVKDFFHSRS